MPYVCFRIPEKLDTPRVKHAPGSSFWNRCLRTRPCDLEGPVEQVETAQTVPILQYLGCWDQSSHPGGLAAHLSIGIIVSSTLFGIVKPNNFLGLRRPLVLDSDIEGLRCSALWLGVGSIGLETGSRPNPLKDRGLLRFVSA